MSCGPGDGCFFVDEPGVGGLGETLSVMVASMSGFTSTPGDVGNDEGVSVVVETLLVAFCSCAWIMPFS